MRFLKGALLLVCALALAACGGGGPVAPAVPQATAVSPEVAASGATITISGTGFGTSGDVLIGGVQATASSWTDTAIQVVVPADAPSGPQRLEVTTAGGASTLDGLFVGAQFDGAAADLQAFIDSQPRGTAVLLESEVYDLGSSPLYVDGRSLHGGGRGETTIVALGMLFVVERGTTVTVADVTLQANSVFYLEGDLDGVRPFSVLNSAAEPTDLESRLSALVALDPQAVPNRGRLVMERVTAEATTMTSSMFGMPPVLVPSLDLDLNDVSLEFENLLLGVAGDMSLEDVEAVGASAIVVALAGSLELDASMIEASGGIYMGADFAVGVSDSTLRAANGDIELLGALTYESGGSMPPFGGPVTVTGSIIEALDADFADATDTGNIEISTIMAPVTLTDNQVIRAHQDVMVSSEAFIGGADIVISGNADIRAGVFVDEDPANFRGGGVVINHEVMADSANEVLIENNTVATTGSLEFGLVGGVDLTVRGNALLVGDGGFLTDFLVVHEGSGSAVIEGNSGAIERGLFIFDGNGGLDVAMSDNEIDFIDAEDGALWLYDVSTGEISGNNFTAVTPSGGTDAVVIAAQTVAVDVQVTGNTFAGFENALSFEDDPVASNGLTVVVNNNVFDMVIDAAPKVADLAGVADEIDARNNQWGLNVDLATVQSYVSLDADTVTAGGSILLDPITVP